MVRDFLYYNEIWNSLVSHGEHGGGELKYRGLGAVRYGRNVSHGKHEGVFIGS